MADTTPTLHDIPDPIPHLPGVTIPLWMLLAGGVACLAVGLALVAWLLLRRKHATSPPALEDVYDTSRSHLQALREEAGSLPVAEVATGASLAVRGYLAACLGEPALFETHEEFLLRDDALDRLPSGARRHINPLLERLAEVKYSPSAPDPDAARGLIDRSLEVLQGLESTRPKPIE